MIFPFVKYIFVFISDKQKIAFWLRELRKWLLNCGCPQSVIDKLFVNAKLQALVKKPSDFRNIFSLVSTYYSNFGMWNIIKSINKWLEQSQNESIKEMPEETQRILSLKQPLNLLRWLFLNRKGHGYFKVCLIEIEKNCKLCALYIKTCTSFTYCMQNQKQELLSQKLTFLKLTDDQNLLF